MLHILFSPGRPGLILYLLPPVFGLLAILLGQDANWDLRNYHLYIPYAFLENRLDYDVAPAQVANFYNPLLYIPYYHAVLLLPPKVFGFLLGALQGCNGLLLWGIGDRLLRRPGRRRELEVLAVTVLGLTGAVFLSEVGTSFADTVLSIVVLGSFWLNLLVLDRMAAGESSRAYLFCLLSGLGAGLVVGLKQPLAIYAVGLCGAFLVVRRPWRQRFGMAFIFGMGVLSGIAVTGGFWLFEMWTRYGNPLFPYFNDFFHSPWALAGSYRDARFLPHGLADILLFPFYFAVAPQRTAEVSFRDFRLPWLYVLAAAWMMQRLWLLCRQIPSTGSVAAGDNGRRYLLAFFFLTFLAWLRLFGIARYLVILEMLAPCAGWLILEGLVASPQYFRWAATASALFLLLATQPGNWGRTTWGASYFGVKVPSLSDPERTVVLMAGTDPQAYLIPFFPKPVRFLRLQSYFTTIRNEEDRFDQRMREIISTHHGPFYALYRGYELNAMEQSLAAYGLRQVHGQCEPLSVDIEAGMKEPLLFCPVRVDS